MLQNKNNHELQAQFSVFVESLDHEQLARPGLLLQNMVELEQLGTLGKVPPDQIKYTLPFPQIGTLPSGAIGIIKPKGAEEVLFDLAEYQNFLGNNLNRTQIRNIEGMLSAYSRLFPLDTSSLTEYTSTLGIERSTLSSGSFMTVERLTIQRQGERQEYVVKKPKEGNLALLNDQVNALALGIGIPGLEQGVAASFSQGEVVTKFVPGRMFKDVSDQEQADIPGKYLDQLKEIIDRASKGGIIIDPNEKNILYSPDAGFTILDYEVSWLDGVEQTQERNYFNMRHILVKLSDNLSVEVS